MQFQLVLIKPANFEFVEAFREPMEVLAEGLKTLGHSAHIQLNRIGDAAIPVIFGAHHIAPADVDRLPSNTIIYNLEQLAQGYPWFTDNYLRILSRFTVWDFSTRNVAFLVKSGVASGAIHVPFGYSPCLRRIVPTEDQDIDVLFFGVQNERRLHVLRELGNAGAKVAALNNVWGTERDAWIARSRIVVNVHQATGGQFEIVRVLYLLANGKAVVSELAPDEKIDPGLEGRLVAAPYERLVTACLDLLGDENRRVALSEAATGVAGDEALSALPAIAHAVSGLVQPDEEKLTASVLDERWYYDVELLPGIVAKGQYPPAFPMLPRMMMRACKLRGIDCLDIGSMEGLIPILMVRQGARRVLSTDAIPHCQRKMDVLRRLYGVSFDFRAVGPLYDLSAKLKDTGGFDFINLSGVLYHVFSPLHVIAGARPLLRKNGLMIISTNVIERDDHTLEFNVGGCLQAEANTFWYHSVPMLEALIRYFKMVPLDFLYCPHGEVYPTLHSPQRKSGFMSVLCRAVDGPDYDATDLWAASSRCASWEYSSFCNEAMLSTQENSAITLRPGCRAAETGSDGLHLFERLDDPKHIVSRAGNPRDSHLLRLADTD